MLIPLNIFYVLLLLRLNSFILGGFASRVLFLRFTLNTQVFPFLPMKLPEKGFCNSCLSYTFVCSFVLHIREAYLAKLDDRIVHIFLAFVKNGPLLISVLFELPLLRVSESLSSDPIINGNRNFRGEWSAVVK